WLTMQAIINMGVNMGLLPTKGLTLPLMSYGGSSLIVSCAAIGLLFRIHYETSGVSSQAQRKSRAGKVAARKSVTRRKKQAAKMSVPDSKTALIDEADYE
ncbi:MAG: hypothetical protein DRQ44_11675, partial [Gammaproteobacteria bacterium]